MRRSISLITLSLAVAAAPPAWSQAVMGAIAGGVTDSAGGSVPSATVIVHNVDTNLEIKATTRGDGSYQILNLPIGNYGVNFSKEGFQTERHTSILVQGD